jgi:3-oxocholest-4-en-26-oate---CoA ligase
VSQHWGRPRGLNLADLFEVVAAAVPEREALVARGHRRSYLELDLRANRVANLLLSWGVRPGARVGALLSNRVELVEVVLGAFKARATPVVVCVTRPVDEARDLLHDAAVEVLAYEPCHSPVVTALAGPRTWLRHLLVLGECRADYRASVGATKYEAALAVRPDAVPGLDRSPDDVHLLYEHPPGGGQPVSRQLRHEDVVVTCLDGVPPSSADELRQRLLSGDEPTPTTVLAPLDEPDGQRDILATLLTGGTAVLDRVN